MFCWLLAGAIGGYFVGKHRADRWYAKQPQPICAPVTLQENQDFIISVPYTYTFTVSNDERWPEHITVDFKASKDKP